MNERFEKWAEAEGYSVEKDDEGRYVDRETAEALAIWRAARDEEKAA